MEKQSKTTNALHSLTTKQIAVAIFLCLILTVASIVLLASCDTVTVDEIDFEMSAEQVGETQNIRVAWDTSEYIDQMTISLYHGQDLVRQELLTDPVAVNAGERTVEAFYGKITVKMEIKRGDSVGSKQSEVKLSATEYNIAPITATMPVTIFSLSLPEITDNGRIPTFVWFKRSGAWNWNCLPDNVYPMPTAKGN